MAFTYTSPSNSDQDAVRFMVGDTVSATHLLEDAEVAWAITLHSTSRLKAAAAECARAMAAKVADAATSKKVGDLALTKNRYANLMTLAERLDLEQGQADQYGAVPLVGGVSVSDKQTREADTDRVAPAFSRGMLDDVSNPQAGGRASPSEVWST